MTIQIRRGWRHFYCSDCDLRWWSATRDCFSHSKETCPTPECYAEVSPHDSDVDATLAVDRMGNLINPPADRVEPPLS